MSVNFVMVRGKKYYVKENKLDLSGKGITDITEIKGLEKLTYLQELDLDRNEISEIKGLENLTNLKKLHLRLNRIREISGLENLRNLQYLNLFRNMINEIQGLENLTNLTGLNLSRNPIREDEKHFEKFLNRKEAQEAVNYCQEKAKMVEKEVVPTEPVPVSNVQNIHCIECDTLLRVFIPPDVLAGRGQYQTVKTCSKCKKKLSIAVLKAPDDSLNWQIGEAM